MIYCKGAMRTRSKAETGRSYFVEALARATRHALRAFLGGADGKRRLGHGFCADKAKTLVRDARTAHCAAAHNAPLTSSETPVLRLLIASHFLRQDFGMNCREEDAAISGYCKDDERQSAQKMPQKASFVFFPYSILYAESRKKTFPATGEYAEVRFERSWSRRGTTE